MDEGMSLGRDQGSKGGMNGQRMQAWRDGLMKGCREREIKGCI